MAESIRGRALPYLKAWRLARFLAQSELATRAGVGKSTIARAERGNEVVSWANLRKIAAALDISPDELLTEPTSDAEADRPRRNAKKSR